jgi:hypothetical protein
MAAILVERRPVRKRTGQTGIWESGLPAGGVGTKGLPRGEEWRQRLRRLRRELLTFSAEPLPRGQVALMDVDPRRLHAYWSVNPDYLSELRKGYHAPRAPLVLRIYELGGEAAAPHHFDLEVEGLTNNLYIDLWAEGRGYIGQIGLKTRRRFISIATSPPVRMPAPAPAEAPSQPPEGGRAAAAREEAAPEWRRPASLDLVRGRHGNR